MLVIFLASADSQSGPHASRIIGPILLWLKPDISPAAMKTALIIFRKFGHLTEYALLGILLYYARVKSQDQEVRPWSRPAALFAFGLATLYAASDEFHQKFVPHREAQVTDVMLDALGASIGLGLLWLWCRPRQRSHEQPLQS